MSEMIERVAKALVGVEGTAHDSSIEDLRPVARAAIAAMLEPTHAMRGVGEKEMMARHPNLDCFNDPYVDSTWKVMIEAALS